MGCSPLAPAAGSAVVIGAARNCRVRRRNRKREAAAHCENGRRRPARRSRSADSESPCAHPLDSIIMIMMCACRARRQAAAGLGFKFGPRALGVGGFEPGPPSVLPGPTRPLPRATRARRPESPRAQYLGTGNLNFQVGAKSRLRVSFNLKLNLGRLRLVPGRGGPPGASPSGYWQAAAATEALSKGGPDPNRSPRLPAWEPGNSADSEEQSPPSWLQVTSRRSPSHRRLFTQRANYRGCIEVR